MFRFAFSKDHLTESRFDAARYRRRKLGGTVSIVGSDLSEEVVSNNVPPVTPATKSKLLRAPLRERTNSRLSEEAGLATLALEVDEKRPFYSAPRKTSKTEPDDDKSAAVTAALMLVKDGLAALRTAGTDPKQKLLQLFATSAECSDVKATVSLFVINRLVDALDAHETVSQSIHERVPDRIDASALDDYDKYSVAAAPGSSFLNRVPHGSAVDVPPHTITKIPDIVDENNLSYGPSRCKTEPGGGVCDTSRCLAQFCGPFILPGTKVEEQSKQVSIASSEVFEVQSGKTEVYKDFDSEDNHSMAETEIDQDESVTDTASDVGTECGSTEKALTAEEAAVSLVGSPFISPGPEVVDISDLDAARTVDGDSDNGKEIVMRVTRPPAMSAVSTEEEEGNAPRNRRKHRQRQRVRIVLSDDDGAPNSPIDAKRMHISSGAVTSKQITLPSVLTAAVGDASGKKRMLRIKPTTRATIRSAKEDAHSDSDNLTVPTVEASREAVHSEVACGNPMFALEKTSKVSTEDTSEPQGCSAGLRCHAMVKDVITSDRMKASIRLGDSDSCITESGDEPDDMGIVTSNRTGVFTAAVDERLTSESCELVTGSADPYGIDKLRTPTPPPQIKYSSAPGGFNSTTPECTGGKKEAGFATVLPPTHSKALSAAFASAAKPGKQINFARHKSAIAHALYDEFNANAFDGRLPPRLEITWNAKLLTTAGLTHYKKITRSSGISEYHARIELSTKVLDSAEKLEATLLHELCHVAAWLVDHCAKPPHGAVFKRWATKAMRVYPAVIVDTCHSYQIHQPFKYRCTQSWCQQEYGRHSKSIDVDAKACGVCNGRLEYIGKFNSDGTRVEEKPPTAFSLFVKEHFGSVRDRLPAGTPHKLVMKELSMQWKSVGRTAKSMNKTPFSTLGEGMRALKL